MRPALGKRAVIEGGKTDAERLTYAFRLCVSRNADADELGDPARRSLDKNRKRFAEGEANAAEVATGEKEPKTPDGLTFADWAAYTLVAACC